MEELQEGIVSGLYIGKDKDSLITSPVEEVEVSWEGFVGDRHAGITRFSGSRESFYPRGTEIRNYRQVSAVSEEELDIIRKKLGIEKLLPEWIGANLLLRGIKNITTLTPLTRLCFQNNVVLVIYGENLPCIEPGKVLQTQFPHLKPNDFPKAAIHNRGIIGWVERKGTISVSEKVVAITPRS